MSATHEYVVQTDYGYGDGWEDTCAADSKADGMRTLKEYRANQPEYPHRLRLKKVSS